MSATKYRDALPPGFKLHWYELESVLGQGGFGITYLGQDTNLGQPVAVKEYLPSEFAVREDDSTVHPKTGEQGEIYEWGLERFLQEARTLAKFKHPNIVRVLSVFEQNNTAYMVMEYERGADLAYWFKRGHLKTESQLLAIFLPIIDGLKLVHQAGFIHRDIKPANIYIRQKDETPVLLDFGSARHALGEQSKTMTSLVSLGYAPFEQYQEADGKQGPWTDIYSLGATLYYAVTGRTPAEAMTRGNAIINHYRDPYQPSWSLVESGYSEHFLNAIDNALAFRFADRPQNLDTWARMLRGEIEAPRIVQDEPAEEVIDLNATVVAPDRPTSRQRTTRTVVSPPGIPKDTVPDRKSFWYMSIAVGIVVVLGLSLLIMTRTSDEVPITTALLTEEDARKAEQNALVAQYIAKADAAFDSGRLISPEGDNALEGYQKALQLAPDNPQAARGMSRLIDHYLTSANVHIREDRLEQAEQSLQIVELMSPDNTAVSAVRSTIVERKLALHALESARVAEQAREEQQRIVEQQQKQKEAERLARIERERRLAKQKEAEPRPVPPQQAARAEIDESAGQRPDLQVASQMLGRFKAAFEQRNVAGIESVAELSPSRRQFVNILFKDYERIEIEISNLAYLEAQKSASAEMTIRELVTSSGESKAPPEGWEHAKLVMRSRGGRQWDKIRW